MAGEEHDAIRRLVRDLGRSERAVVPNEIAHLRRFFAERVLPSHRDITEFTAAGRYLLAKFDRHVRENEEWPANIAPDDYLASLAAAIRQSSGGVRLYQDPLSSQWTVLFLARTPRRFVGPQGGRWIVVLFNGERPFWVTGFQVRDGRAYAARQGGWWLKRPD